MKVLWFSNTPALGNDYLNKDSKIKGTGGWMYSLNTTLQDEVELSLAFHHPYNLAKFRFAKTSYFPIFTGNIIIENLKRRFFNKIYNQDFLKDYLKIIDEVNPDVIHIHGTENSFLCILGKTKTPVVISIQGNLTVYKHKFFTGFHGKYLNYKNQKTSIKSILFGKNSFSKGYNIMKKMSDIEQQHLKSALHIIGRTDWDKRITRVLAPNSFYHNGNEILRDGFYKKKWDNVYKDGKIVLFTTNGDNYYKGFETICHSISLLNDLNYEVEWRVAGVSKNSLINKITKKHLGSNYPERGSVLLGSLDEDALIKNLQESHIYIMPSHIENSPNNLCEAMILGMPCIATFSGGTASMLLDREEGILVQDGDPWVMAGAIIELIKDKNNAKQMGKKARMTALVRHDKKNIVNELINNYEVVIKHNNEN